MSYSEAPSTHDSPGVPQIRGLAIESNVWKCDMLVQHIMALLNNNSNNDSAHNNILNFNILINLIFIQFLGFSPNWSCD